MTNKTIEVYFEEKKEGINIFLTAQTGKSFVGKCKKI